MRWVLALGVAIYVSMYFIGRDHGQVRWGLIGAAPESRQQATVAAPVAKVAVADTVVAPAPAGIVVTALAEARLAAVTGAGTLSFAAPTLLKPGETLGPLLQVVSLGAVVREGPGIQYKLVARLGQGTEVQEVQQPSKLVGWSVIQFADPKSGVRKQGYVVSRLVGRKRE